LHVEQENPVLVNARVPTVKAADTEETPAAAPAAAAPAPADASKEKDKA